MHGIPDSSRELSPQEQAQVVRAAYEAYNTRDFEGARQYFSEDLLLLNIPTGEMARGPDGYQQQARGWETAMPDRRIEILSVTPGSDEGIVSIEYLSRGTHTGPLLTASGHVPPTGSHVDLRYHDAVHVQGGRIREIRSYYDSATLLRQMGLLGSSPLHAPDRRATLDLYAAEVDSNVPQRNKAIVQRFLQEVVNRRNPGAAADVCSPNLAWNGGPLGRTHDLSSFQKRLAAFLEAFPDLHVEVKDAIAEGDRVMTRVEIHGTHLGEFHGLAPSGKRISVEGVNGYLVVKDRILEETWFYDLLGILEQIGAVAGLPHPS